MDLQIGDIVWYPNDDERQKYQLFDDGCLAVVGPRKGQWFPQSTLKEWRLSVAGGSILQYTRCATLKLLYGRPQ